MQVERGRVGGVATRHDDDARADADAVAMQVRRCRRREHDARAVIAREDKRLLDRSGREHDLASPHLPESLARGTGRSCRPMIRETLAQPDEVVREVAEGRRACQQRHVRLRAKCSDAGGEPLLERLTVDGRSWLVQKRAAGFGLFVAEQDPGAGPRRRQRRREACWTRADDEHVAMSETLRVAIGIRRGRSAAQPGCAAYGGFIPAMPGRSRPHECLVVERRGQERREHVVDRQHVEPERGPAVLALGDESLVNLDLRRAQVRRASSGIPHDRYERIRLLGTGAEQPARAVILKERPKHATPLASSAEASVSPAKPW
jgi:hypothetical protein